MNDILDTTKRRACSTMNTIAGEICARLRKLALLDADKEEFMYFFKNRLPDMLVCLKSDIEDKQKTLSRHIVPFIQNSLRDTYVECSTYTGSGMFLRIKQTVCEDISSLKSSMFGDGINVIIEELKTLKVEIVERVTGVFYSLIEDLKTGFKSLIDSTPDYRSLQNILKKCAKVLREISSNQDSQQENDSQNSSGGWTHDLEVGTSQTSQSAEFGDSFKRKLDFDEFFRDMKRQKSECYSPDDLDLVLIESKADYEKQHGFKSRLKKNCHANGLEFRGVTPVNGDCFFEAISSQLQRIESRYIDPKELRLSVAEYIRENPTYMGKDGIVSLKDYMGESLEEYCEKMSKKTTWADHIVMAMARMLKYDIVIVTSSPSTSGDNCLIWVKGDEDDGKKLLLLGHLWEYYYQSLQPTSA